ncbi:MAG: hypothetical protein CVU08_01160 [Bacteroidetes bacterium HGW-Bacteroidetes-3]|nr:MAG: hypothetical protein CVU08_01160 [Bacteroidetes bacterium HGW-Bacteroidetes-3]
MKNLIFIAFLFISNGIYSQKDKLTVSGDWSKIITASDISDAGNDYQSSFVSLANQSLITISPGGNSNNYVNINVRVHKEDNAWHNNLNLKIRRTSNGTNGNAIISGGLSFQTITGVATTLFSCTGNHTLVPLQYEILGVSVLLPVQTYSTTVVFTITNF